MDGNGEGVCNDRQDAKRMVTIVQAGCLGASGACDSANGGRSKLSAADQMDCGFIRVGSIKCSAFGGLQQCQFPM